MLLHAAIPIINSVVVDIIMDSSMLVMSSLVPRLHSPAFYIHSANKSWGVESVKEAKYNVNIWLI